MVHHLDIGTEANLQIAYSRYAKEGIKIGVSVNFTSMVSNESCSPLKKINNLVYIVRNYGFQGVEIDYTSEEIANESQDFVRGELLKSLRYKEGFFVSQARKS